ncbi:hypothetical protein LC087_16880 [Bacillus carboniphilus]|uniref:YvlB/LiaX N-terminal domain-containing protein n=1 Tax=Bacillus carboniphilus TaxID=86663 RepID=A0ABY9JVB2_9BACI|nr:hypothetical protein [Bacillus carboniphilus]WLR42360.1 hypothetical protein LC087_16880 [Bacillus carboniphilus]
MKEEISKVLEMVKEGKVTSEEATEIIAALKGEREDPLTEKSSYLEKRLKVIVDSKDGDKVNVNLPLKLVKSVHGAVENLPIVQEHLKGADINLILEAIANNVEGPIVDIKGADGETVLVVIQ